MIQLYAIHDSTNLEKLTFILPYSKKVKRGKLTPFSLFSNHVRKQFCIR